MVLSMWWRKSKGRQYIEQAYSKDEKNQIQDNVQITSILHRIANEVMLSRKQSENQDHKNNIREFVTIVFVITTAIFTGGSAWIFWYQLAAMRDDQRAWVGAPKLIIETVGSGSFKFDLAFKNVGKMPTHGLFVGARNIVNSTPVWKAEVKKQCEIGISFAREDKDTFEESAIVPDSETYFSNTPKYIDINATKNDLFSREIGKPLIAGCVVYGTRSDNNLHSTGFVMQVLEDSEGAKSGFIYSIRPD